jgi:hypothetical protein
MLKSFKLLKIGLLKVNVIWSPPLHLHRQDSTLQQESPSRPFSPSPILGGNFHLH